MIDHEKMALIATKSVMNSKEPIHFSDYYNIDKATLNELGVFEPILNFDTKVFFEPLLLKNSASEIILLPLLEEGIAGDRISDMVQ